MNVPSSLAGATLIIDLGAIVDNWRRLRHVVAPAECAATVKANAYGLGAARVGAALRRAGCVTFFVATVEEGIELRRVLSRPRRTAGARSAGRPAVIYVLNGCPAGAEEELAARRLRPVLNSLEELERWARAARRSGRRRPAALHLDTGMARLGLPAVEFARLEAEPARLEGVALALVMSHLACADVPDHPLNAHQLALFRERQARLPTARRSLANSSGIFLGTDYHFDLVRPGAALYGIAPMPQHPNPMRGVVRLQGRVLQVREIDPPQTVGYGASHRAEARERIATVAVGYADGYLRALSNRSRGFVGEAPVPLVGRVSMDLITFDVSKLAPDEVRPGDVIDLIGPSYPVDAIAADAGTIGYEILTQLGHRYQRVYLEPQPETEG